MDSTENKGGGGGGAVDIMAAVLNNMNKELPMMNSSSNVVGNHPKEKRALTDLNDHHLHDLDDLERSDNGDGSEKKDESTEKKGKGGAESSNTSNETADSDGDIFVSASNKLVGYRYSVDELLEIATVESSKSRPDFVSSELFKVSSLSAKLAFVD